jgi:hypothetical protein
MQCGFKGRPIDLVLSLDITGSASHGVSNLYLGMNLECSAHYVSQTRKSVAQVRQQDQTDRYIQIK